MKTAPAEPADAPVPPSGTEQTVEEQQKPKTDATSSVLSDIADVGEVVVDALTLIFDQLRTTRRPGA
jgi:hypothetical protein